MTRYLAEIESRVDGIPCLIGVINFTCVRGSFSYSAASDMDYHGYTDAEYEILDRRGRSAPWLACKVDDDIDETIRETIVEYFRDERGCLNG